MIRLVIESGLCFCLRKRSEKVQVGNDQENAQSERNSLSKNRGGKKKKKKKKKKSKLGIYIKQLRMFNQCVPFKVDQQNAQHKLMLLTFVTVYILCFSNKRCMQMKVEL